MTVHQSATINASELLRDDPGRWDRLIAADLATELKQSLNEGPSGIPEMRRFLAVKGFRSLRTHLQEAVADRRGQDAVRAAIIGMRDFARERPGLSAATFRTQITDCPEWREAGAELAVWLCGLLAEIGIAGSAAQHALRTIRAFVRGFVIHEMQGSFLENSDLEDSFLFGVDILVRGLVREYPPLSSTKPHVE